MRLKKISLTNFRCFEHLDIDLHPRLTVFVGGNGAGKTAIMDGIATALSPVLTHLSSANQRLIGRGIKDTDFRIEAWDTKVGKERWGASAYAQVTAETTEGLAWDYWRPSVAGKSPPKKTGEAELSAYLSKVSDSFKTSAPTLMPVFAYYGDRRGHIEVPDRLRTSKENYSYPATALMGALDSLSNFKELLKWFDLEEAAELRANKGIMAADFEESPALGAVRAAVVALLGGAYTNPHFNKEHKFVMEPKGGGPPLQVGQLSQGYQSMLALAMDFARRLAIGNPHIKYGDDVATTAILQEIQALGTLAASSSPSTSNPFPEALAMSAPAIMLIDEIDLHLHPTWQQRVLGDLMRTFPATQFIVTTHSPQVLSTVRRENIRVLADGGITTPDFSPLAHEAGDALAQIMVTHTRPQLPVLDDVYRYEQLVRTGQETSAVAIEVRQALDAAGYQIPDSDLHTWRFLAKRQPGQGT
jgi:predicted ATP-binding protein involved in virulence